MGCLNSTTENPKKEPTNRKMQIKTNEGRK